MGLQKQILNLALKIVNVLTFWIHTQSNRITFISLTQDHLTSDFLLLDEALKKEQKYEIHYNLIQFDQSLKSKVSYFFNCLKQLVECKKSALILLNDNNYVISTYKPKTCQVLQIWHACGAIKKFGNEIQREYPIQNYDAVICNAPYWQEIYAKSFGVRPQQVHVTGMPRCDTLLKTKADPFFSKHPECKGKKIILYAPTFRGNIIHGFQVISFDIKKVQEMFPDCCIVYKFHPLLGNIHVDDTTAINANEEDLYTLMQASDCLISDYSSVILDYSLLHKPIIGYISDIESYVDTIGLNITLEQYPGPVCRNELELIDALKHLDSYDYQKEQAFQQMCMTYTDGKNTHRCIELIDTLMKKHPISE